MNEWLPGDIGMLRERSGVERAYDIPILFDEDVSLRSDAYALSIISPSNRMTIWSSFICLGTSSRLRRRSSSAKGL